MVIDMSLSSLIVICVTIIIAILFRRKGGR